MRPLAAFAAGLIFGLGLVVSDMINPAKVLNFLDIAGSWDPSLVFVMGTAVVTAAIGYRLVFRLKTPLLGGRFVLPNRTDIDARLIGGAALFGIGWGLAGFCPGPAISAAATGRGEVFVFLAAMAVGMLGADRLAPPASRP